LLFAFDFAFLHSRPPERQSRAGIHAFTHFPMLGYYINNLPLALSPDTSVKIIYYNPACYFDEIPGDVAMGIELDANETNRALLGNPERFEKYSVKNDREFTGFEIRFSGKLLFAGTLIIQATSDESYSGWSRNNVGNLGKEHRDKFIYDIPAFMQLITFENKANYNPLTDPYGCPTFFNPDFFRDKGRMVDLTKKVPNPDYVDLTNFEDWLQDLFYDTVQPYIDEPYKTEALSEAFRRSCAFFVNTLNPDKTVNTIGSIVPIKKIYSDLFVNVLSPMLFLNFIITMLLRDAHFYIDKNAIAEHEDLQKLILYNNFDITHVDFVTGYVTVNIPEIETDGYIIPAVTYTTGSVQDISRSYDAKFLYRDLLPKIKLKDFFISIQNLLNVCFQFHTDGKVDIIDRETIIDSQPIDISKFMVGKWNMGEKKDVTLKFIFNHDDSDSMFSEKWTDIDDRRLLEGDPVGTLQDLENLTNPVFGEIRYIVQTNTYSEYAWTLETQIDPSTGDEVAVDVIGWKHLSTGFQNGLFNRDKTEEEEIKTDFSTLYSSSQTTQTLQKGNMETIKYAYEKFTPRLMFYLGNNQAKNETDNIALDWEKKTKGLLTTRWPKWNRFWCQRQPVSRNAALPLNMIDYISRNITKKFNSLEGDFIIETMETEFSIDTIGDTNITGYKGSYQPPKIGLSEHWLRDNLIMDDTLINFNDIDLNFNTNLDLFPFGTL
jgi:hypothetical protein